MRSIFRLFLTINLSFTILLTFAQDGRNITGNWMMYFGQLQVADKWSIHNEVQWRNHEVLPNLEQLLLRGGINYHINKQVMATAGYGYISTHPFDKEVLRTLSNEHRIWQQLLFRNSTWRISFEHRLRYEQRWVNSNFGQRARYRLMATVPVNKPNVEPGAFVVAVYNEFFGNIDPDNVFDRNRIYGAVGYQFTSAVSAQVGFLRQNIPAYGKNYLQFALFFNPKLSE